MEVDINEPKSKAFNIFLRMFQLGGQLTLAYWASRYEGISGCDYSTPDIVSYLAYALVALNLVSLIFVRCNSKFPRGYFFLVFGLDLLLVVGIALLQLIRNPTNCASNRLYYQFTVIECVIAIVLAVVILVMRLAWEQRYTNAPGNLVWPVLFLIFHWSPKFKLVMLIIGFATLAVSLTTLILHLTTLSKTSTTSRRVIIVGWVLGIIVLVALQVLAIIVYLTSGAVTEYIDVQAKKTLAVFIAVNALDILFWLWGLRALDYEKGDQIRDDLFHGAHDLPAPSDRYNDRSTVVSNNIGTVR